MLISLPFYLLWDWRYKNAGDDMQTGGLIKVVGSLRKIEPLVVSQPAAF